MKREIERLTTMLDIANIPYELTMDSCGNENNQVWYPSRDHAICDVICHKYSYGGEDGYLEMMGLSENDDDDVEGWLTAEEVFFRIFMNDSL